MRLWPFAIVLLACPTTVADGQSPSDVEAIVTRALEIRAREREAAESQRMEERRVAREREQVAARAREMRRLTAEILADVDRSAWEIRDDAALDSDFKLRADASPVISLGAFQDEPAPSGENLATAGAVEDDATLADKQINPLSDLWSLVFQYDGTVIDSAGTSGESLVHSFKFQPVMPIDLTEDIRLITRPVFELRSAEVPTGGLNLDRDTGLGDTTLATLLGPASKEASGWFWGVGASWGFPTATEDSLGSKQFTVGPAATVWHFGEDWVLGTFAQTFFSYANTDSDRPSTNILNNQLFILRNIPGTLWKVGMTPNIVYDFKNDDLSLPIGLGATSMMKIGDTNVRVLFEVQYYLENDFAEEEWNFRILFAPIIRKPSVFEKPLFR